MKKNHGLIITHDNMNEAQSHKAPACIVSGADPVCFYLHEVLEQVKLIGDDKKSEKEFSCGGERGSCLGCLPWSRTYNTSHTDLWLSIN